MNDDSFLGLMLFIVLSALLFLAGFGVTHLIGDYRRFAVLVEQCEKYGYIQDETVRLTCTKEKRP